MKLQIKWLQNCVGLAEWYGNPVLEVMFIDHDEPTNYEEAMMSPDSNKWLEAMKSKIGSMYENKVWTLVDLPDDQRPIENKWIDTSPLNLLFQTLLPLFWTITCMI